MCICYFYNQKQYIHIFKGRDWGKNVRRVRRPGQAVFFGARLHGGWGQRERQGRGRGANTHLLVEQPLLTSILPYIPHPSSERPPWTFGGFSGWGLERFFSSASAMHLGTACHATGAAISFLGACFSFQFWVDVFGTF